MDEYRRSNFIGNKWIEDGNGSWHEVFNKYNGTRIGKLPSATEDQLEEAIVLAEEAFQTTRSWSAGKRSEMLEKVLNALKKRKEEFIQLIIDEAGKPRSYAKGEVARAISTLQLAVEEARRHKGEMLAIDWGIGEGKNAFTQRVPLGVVACITPFNFPLNLVMHKVAPALACGCTVIVKPAPQAPLSSLALAALFLEAGYPKGAINVFMCEVPLAEKLVKDERIAKLSFTGSDKVGWHLKAIAGKKKVTLELGGNAAVIIDEDTALKPVVAIVAKGSYLYAGQICISTQRIVVHEKVYEEFLALLLKEIANFPSGDPNEEEVLSGPVIDKGHLKRIDTWVKEAVEMGAEVLIGGGILSEKHALYAPSLLTNCNEKMKIESEEVFGPVAVITRVGSFEEAIKKVNNSRYGLQVGVFTNSIEHFKQAVDKLEVGGIIMNNIPGFRMDNMPYGGVKDSGLGREGVRYAMDEMTESRLIVF
jgi:glyceraldehyde-3-phosphate dehydrogenase (NADP+)